MNQSVVSTRRTECPVTLLHQQISLTENPDTLDDLVLFEQCSDTVEHVALATARGYLPDNFLPIQDTCSHSSDDIILVRSRDVALGVPVHLDDIKSVCVILNLLVKPLDVHIPEGL